MFDFWCNCESDGVPTLAVEPYYGRRLMRVTINWLLNFAMRRFAQSRKDPQSPEDPQSRNYAKRKSEREIKDCLGAARVRFR